MKQQIKYSNNNIKNNNIVQCVYMKQTLLNYKLLWAAFGNVVAAY